MSRKIKYESGISEVQRVLDTASRSVQVNQIQNSIATSMSRIVNNNQLLVANHSIIRQAERMNNLFNDRSFKRIMTSITNISGVANTSKIFASSNDIQNIIKSVSAGANTINYIQRLNRDINPDIFNSIQTMKSLSINTTEIQRNIQSNLNLFRDIDWSEVIDSEDLEKLDIENSLDELTADVVDGIGFQQQIVEFANKFKIKYPGIFYFILIFVWSPIQSAINDEVLDIIKGTTEPIVQEVKINNYNNIGKNIKIEVNNILNINIESKEVKDDIYKNFRYVTTDKLVMRQGNRVKSKAIYILEFGQVVKIIGKNRNWTLVEYEKDEDGIQGWVFTRYISKFKK